MSNKGPKKAKIIKGLHTVADKTGKFVRKAAPVVAGAVATVVVLVVTGGKSTSHKA